MTTFLNGEEYYLRFTGPISNSIPQELLPFLDIIMKESDWLKTGLLKKDENGKYLPIEMNGNWYRFMVILQANNDELLSIKTGKKCVHSPWTIATYINLGCSFDDFIEVSDDLKFYCEAYKQYYYQNYDKAFEAIQKALSIKNHVKEYINLLNDINKKMK